MSAEGPAAQPGGGSQRIGEYLVGRGWLAARDLERALAIQARSGERLGTILLAFGWVTRRHLFQALSALWGLPYVELAGLSGPVEAYDFWPLESALRHSAVVWGGRGDTFDVAVAGHPTEALRRELGQAAPGATWRFQVTTHWDLNHHIRSQYRTWVLERSVTALLRQRPDESAYTVFTPVQFALLATALAGLVVALAVVPVATLSLLNLWVTASFLVSIAFKFVVAMAGLRVEGAVSVAAQEVAALDPASLPTYTILVPVYHEANIVRQVMQHVSAMDYPPEKLEVLILIEEDDAETWEAAKAARPPGYVHLVRIPDGLPKTKPKACNVGLMFARGEYLVIYDAEDRPEPDQLKKAVIAFQRGPDRLICVQAALNYFNWNDNWLTKMFTLEYSYWFDYMLPGLQRLRLPIPLGGTSNHFRTDRLRELGGWDPFNVTEDADLGIRAAARGYEIGVIDSTTFEEANCRLHNWIRQRSRWLKGYMQTVLVHSRAPLRMMRRVGLRQTLGLWLLIGGTPLSCLLHLPSLAVYLFWLATRNMQIGVYFPPLALYVGLFCLLVGNGMGVYLCMMAVFKRKQHQLTLYCLANPVYWILHSVAAYRAAWQLVTKPSYWEKTLHGLSVRSVPSPAGADGSPPSIAL